MFARPRQIIPRTTCRHSYSERLGETNEQHDQIRHSTGNVAASGKTSDHVRHDSATDLTFAKTELEMEERRDSAMEFDGSNEEKPQVDSTQTSMVNLAALLREDTHDCDDVYTLHKNPTPPSQHNSSPRLFMTSPRVGRKLTTSSLATQRRQPWTPPFDLSAFRKHLLHNDRITATLKHERPYLSDIFHLERRLVTLDPTGRNHAFTLTQLETCKEDLEGARLRMMDVC